MSDQSQILSLPLIQPSQAQKHVTHNEALRILDAVVQLSVAAAPGATPPATPAQGERHIVGPGATGVWAGQDNNIAVYELSTWGFFTPLAGWQAVVTADNSTLIFDGSAWVPPGLNNLDGVGIATSWDTTNRLAVASDAVLFTHAGSDQQLKINKASTADTASLLFQDGFSGRSEIGLAGDDDLQVKVSTDGATWRTGFTVAKIGAQAELKIGEYDTVNDNLTFKTMINGVDKEYKIGPRVSANRLNFDKPTSDVTLTDGSYYGFNGVGSLAAGNPFWQGILTFGPRVTESGANKFPALSQHWSATNRDDPTDLKYVFKTANSGGLKTDFVFETINDGDINFKPGPSGGRAVFDGPAVMRSYTVATVPAAGSSGAGAMIYVSNETGGAVMAFSDGSNWRRMTDRAIIS